jgi:hypothetical protein
MSHKFGERFSIGRRRLVNEGIWLSITDDKSKFS